MSRNNLYDTKKRSVKRPSKKRSVKRPSKKRSVKTPSKKRSVKRPSKKRLVKRPSKKRSVKRPSKKRSVKRPSKKRSVKKPSKKRSVKRPSKKRSVKRPSKKRSVKRPSKKRSVKRSGMKGGNNKSREEIRKAARIYRDEIRKAQTADSLLHLRGKVQKRLPRLSELDLPFPLRQTIPKLREPYVQQVLPRADGTFQEMQSRFANLEDRRKQFDQMKRGANVYGDDIIKKILPKNLESPFESLIKDQLDFFRKSLMGDITIIKVFQSRLNDINEALKPLPTNPTRATDYETEEQYIQDLKKRNTESKNRRRKQTSKAIDDLKQLSIDISNAIQMQLQNFR
jgi:hypothetical protein